MTAEEYRSDPLLVANARALRESDTFKTMLAVMRSRHPVNAVAPDSVTPHGAHILLGEQTGWQQYENDLLALATRLPMPNDPGPTTYAAEQEQQE
jgi:hypothetical protein